MEDFKIAIVGLGLMGGSLAYALQGFRGAALLGVDCDPEVRAGALQQGAVTEVFDQIVPAIAQADLTIFCTYPESILHDVKTHHAAFKAGSVVTDICGAKGVLCHTMGQLLPPEVDYVGIHPMAGKEVDGFANAEASIFKGSGFIITPLDTTRPDSITMMRDLASYIGAISVAVTTPQSHDDIIAYTSDLMHISAAALCINFHPNTTPAYTAGAFRDCTRIANLNPTLWAQLLLENGHYITPHLERYMANLSAIHTAIETQDAASLYTLLDTAKNNKRELPSK